MERIYRNSGIADFYALPHEHAPREVATHLAPMVKLLDLLGGNCWIAGGAIRDRVAQESHVDTDVFFANDEAFADARARLYTADAVRTVLLDALAVWRAETEFGRIDLVRKRFADPLFTIQAFDFTACCAALSKTHFVMHRDFMSDAIGKKLRINALPEPRSTVRRVKRFAKRGWTMAQEELAWLHAEAEKTARGAEDEYEAWE